MRASEMGLRLWGSIALALALGGASLPGCLFGGKDPQEQVAARKVDESTLELSDDAMKNIKVAKAEQGEFPERLSLMGRISVTEDRIAVVPARIAGRIDGVYVASGQQVREGDPLVSLFSADFAIAREEYLQAAAQARNPGAFEGRKLLQMARQKLNTMGMSYADIDRIPSSKAEQTNLVIRAPRSGVILDKKAVIGNVVNVGDTLFTLGDLSKVWFAGDIYPEDLSKVHKDQEIMIDPLEDGRLLFGKVSFISPVIDPSTRTIKIRALIDNSNSALRADMYVKGNVTLSRRSALLIPTRAVVRMQDVTTCFKRLGGKNLFKQVNVVVSKEQDGVAIVESGLAPGDEVVSEGGLLLSAALHVTGGS